MYRDVATNNLLQNSSDIVRSYVGRNSIVPSELVKLIGDVHAALAGLEQGSSIDAATPVLIPAVSVKKSITPDYLICLDDGKRFTSMKLHIAQLGMTPDEYRAKWNLPSSYPMVAPNYSAKRSALAKKHGLGRKAAKPARSRSKAKS
jgi:predicted transcriptional regulator